MGKSDKVNHHVPKVVKLREVSTDGSDLAPKLPELNQERGVKSRGWEAIPLPL